MTDSMRKAIGETDRRRAKQLAYNQQHGITAKSIVKAIDASLVEMYSPEWAVVPEVDGPAKQEEYVPAHELPDRITGLRKEMLKAAEDLDFERAAELRDQIKRMERRALGLDAERPTVPSARLSGRVFFSGQDTRCAHASPFGLAALHLTDDVHRHRPHRYGSARDALRCDAPPYDARRHDPLSCDHRCDDPHGRLADVLS